MGDFNINLLSCESHSESNDFLLMLSLFFFYLISYNQHVLLKDQQPSLIIYLQILMLYMNAISVNLVYNISDHLPQFLIGGAKVQVTGQATGQVTGQITGHTQENRTLDKTLLD